MVSITQKRKEITMLTSELILEICHNIDHNNVRIIKNLFEEIDNLSDHNIQVINLFVNRAVQIRQDPTLFVYFMNRFSSRIDELDWDSIVMNASWLAHPDSMEYILEHGHIPDMEWAFRNSAMFGRLDMLKLYFKYGYTISDKTKTALELAKSERRTNVVLFLRNRGVV